MVAMNPQCTSRRTLDLSLLKSLGSIPSERAEAEAEATFTKAIRNVN